MLKQRSKIPRIVHAVAISHWAFPLFYIAALTSLYNFSFSTITAVVFSLPYILHSFFSVYVGFCLYKLKPWAWFAFLTNMTLVTLEQFYIALVYAESQFVLIPLVLALIVIIACVYLVKLELRVPYFSPRIAWWESDPRYKITIPAQALAASDAYDGLIMDISPGGCFMKTKAPLQVDTLVDVHFSFFELPFRLKGRVVWKTVSGVTHPQGIGVRFMGLSRPQKEALLKPVKEFEKLSRSVKQKRKEEKASSFEQKIESLQQKRKY